MIRDLNIEHRAQNVEETSDLATERLSEKDKTINHVLYFGLWTMDFGLEHHSLIKPLNRGFLNEWCERGESNPHRVTSTGS